jgi:FAD-linked oxidoreductase
MNHVPLDTDTVGLPRRSFVVASAATLLAGLLEPVSAAAPEAERAAGPTWQNWSGLLHARPSAIATPANEAELQALMARSQGEIRPMGSAHSSAALVPTSGTIVTTDRMSGLVSVDRQAMTVTAHAGTRLGTLTRLLDTQTLAGAMSTGTHGTGAKLPGLHADIVEMRIVTPDGRIVALDDRQNAEMLPAARVSLGSLGLISQVTLRVVPTYNLERRVWLVPINELMESARSLAAKHRHFGFFYLPFTGFAAAITQDIYTGSDLISPPTADNEVLADLRRMRDWLGHFPQMRRWLAQKLLSRYEPEVERERSYRLLAQDRPNRFNETEWHVPVQRSMDCLREVITTLERRNEVFWPMEIRFIAGDDAWLSPFYQQDSCSIAVQAASGEQHDYLLTDFTPIFRAHGGRPHWGKLHTLNATELASAYPRWADFQRVRRHFDPQGRMLNEHLRKVFGIT